ncbi:U4/U6 small nuclear ribonucleoprotein Prp31 [Myotis brandtii]|uniref:U4/U6 small nuclear ribonucleoprotein Prp31 n=1 Tax=Myotis brandtii TaxID=109478 RepID=S7NI48_MYOBR|nr:U4/U6 small nuclear ribonucleoprotein Prp31 [Myotis brandtii]
MPPAPPTSDIIHKFIRDKYSKRFPELESLVPNALDYIRTVKELGNSLDKCKNNENLQQILTNATIMVVSVTASTTQGQQLSEEELERLEEACDMALELNASKHRIYEYVESRMSFIAPNLSIIIGASTAAKIMGVAGGLTNLSKMPACNIMLLGAQRKTLSGFSSTSVLPHTGYIYHSDIVQSLPPAPSGSATHSGSQFTTGEGSNVSPGEKPEGRAQECPPSGTVLSQHRCVTHAQHLQPGLPAHSLLGLVTQRG